MLHLAVAVRSQVVMKEFCAAASQYSQAKADLRNIETRLAYGAHKALEILGKFREGQHLLCNDLENFRNHFLGKPLEQLPLYNPLPR